MSIHQVYPFVEAPSIDVAKALLSAIFGAIIAASLSGCGASFGESAIGFSSFMERHNEKLRILSENQQAAAAPLDWHTQAERRQLSKMVQR